MAIYHFSGKVISRSQGRSSVAASAYRAAEKLKDERTGLIHDFTKKKDDVFYKEILLPKDAPAWMGDREKLWNHVEQIEKRKDAQLAREFNISLPKELTEKQNIELAREFVNKQFIEKGMVADMCLHRGNQDGEEQPHIHVMLSLREITPEGFGKKVRAWNSKDLLIEYREAWAEHCNHYLALHDHDMRIDHRTLEAQGIDLEPQNKIGAKEAQARLAKLAEHQQIARDNGECLVADPSIALTALTHQQSTFTLRDIARFAHRHSVDETQFQSVFAAVKASPELITLGQDTRGQTRFSTREMIKIEHYMVTDAIEKAGQYTHPVDLLIQENVLERHTLNAEQRAGFTHLLHEGDMACLVGFAGSGKSTLLGAAKQAWQRAGYRVQGMALSGIAAENLAHSADMPCNTIANRLLTWVNGREFLDSRDILVVDEAGMIGSRQMAELVDKAKVTGAKLILVGDPEQLQAIDAGGAFRAIAERTGYAKIDTILRQQEVWQREAVKQFALGQTAEGLQAFQELTHIVCEYYPSVIMIILFGSYARGNWVEEKYEDNIHYRYQSDFDILIIVEERNKSRQLDLEHSLEETLDRSDKIKTPVSILVHNLDFVNAHLLRTQYFFSDIKREGVLLYGVKQFQLQEPKKMTRQDRIQYAQEDFEFWLDSANTFLETHQFNFERGKLPIAAFELHQVAERLYTTILLVYTRYKPSTHDLRTLRKMVNSIDDRFGQVFLIDNQENKRLFDLLRAAYVDARYKKTYAITHEELIKLQEEVKKLQALTESLCQEKIASFAK